MKKLTPKDFESVKQAVVDVESMSRGEIVPLVVAHASDYRWVRYRTAWIGLAVAIMAGEVWSYFRTWPLDAHELFLIALAGALLGAAVASFPAFARFALGKDRLTHDVHVRALAEFSRQGCANTRERTGILVMVALLERRIEIIADEGVQKIAMAKEGPEVWDRICVDFSKAAAQGQAVEGLIGVIRRLGTLLGRYFPADGSIHSELSNDLRTEES